MPFIHPGIFAIAVGAVSVPILIHLLNRRRFKTHYWAAMKFLLDSLRKNRRRLRIEELILLAMRCLMILLLGLALARYTGCQALRRLPIGSPGSQTVVLILDDSYSMGQRVGDRSVFDEAKTGLAEEIKKLSPSDTVTILLTSRPKETDAYFGPTFLSEADANTLIERVKARPCSDSRAQLAEAMAAAGKVFQEYPSQTQRLFLFGDFRKVDLTGRERTDQLRRQFAALAEEKVRVLVMDYGSRREARTNLTAGEIRLLTRFAIARRPVRIGLTVRNHGKVRAKNVEVRLTARLKAGDGLKTLELPVQVIDAIRPGQTQQIEFALSAPQPGPAVVTAEMPADELPGDNTAQIALDVRKAVRILVVDGQPDLTDPAAGESYFFVRALDPNLDGSYGNELAVIPAEGVAGVSFDDYDMVALLNVGSFPVRLAEDGKVIYPQLDALEEYVRGGGGLAIFVGDRIDKAFYDRMYAGGAGLSPLRILNQREGDPEDNATYYQLAPKSLDAAGILNVFSDDAKDVASLIRFFAFTKADPLGVPVRAGDVKPPRILARFADADRSPAVVARQFGAGAVVMFYSTADALWNDWPTDMFGTYVVVMFDMRSALARAQEGGFTGRVGEPIVFDLDAAAEELTAWLKPPREGDVVALQAVRSGDKARLRYERVHEAGVYALALRTPAGAETQVLFARNVDPAEGDLTPGGKDEIISAFGSDEFRYFEQGAAAAPASTASEKEYWLWAIAALLVLMGLEVFLGQRFGHYAQK